MSHTKYFEKPKSGAQIALTNPQSPTNVGAVMRAAGCYRVDSVVYTGVRFDRVKKFHTDTQQAGRKIPLTSVGSILDGIDDDVKVVCIDLIEGAVSLPEFEHPEKALYVFGPEDGTVEQDVIDKADAVVYIPTVGCMNLAATVNVVLYDRLAKSKNTITGDELIRKSRDRNNNSKTKSPDDNG